MKNSTLSFCLLFVLNLCLSQDLMIVQNDLTKIPQLVTINSAATDSCVVSPTHISMQGSSSSHALDISALALIFDDTTAGFFPDRIWFDLDTSDTWLGPGGLVFDDDTTAGFFRDRIWFDTDTSEAWLGPGGLVFDDDTTAGFFRDRIWFDSDTSDVWLGPGGLDIHFGDTSAFMGYSGIKWREQNDEVEIVVDPSNGLITINAPNVFVNGVLSKLGGSFKIDHPDDPQNKYLYHSFVESPDMMNVYNGNIITDAKGVALVTLPDYFEALNIDYRYQLTVIGTFAQAMVSSEIKNNQFEITTDKPHVKVSWQITGVRNDPFARDNRIQVEVDKGPEAIGTLLYEPVAQPKSDF